ncbi:winged helix DNA-binding domain-containing protein [Streptomyces lonarensis]|uniref:Winged helix DNA-binding domain-containing protein n=1 Tax=Streptomyces lonarensis TaxID=700599 RepID=A0A7X6CZF1_9ACTN|nr:winged helix DNA-binding domain-containing protein [Streptomyces lonarensis]NJQ05373.1 winged helix DNA-binding domain-containing protein [Streptomyces lonarensis]
MTVLDDRALNRATLARQYLLERSDAAPLDVVSHLAGVQAQEPQEPFVGLWARTRGFRPEALDALVTGRAVVRTHLMRRTVHLVAASDALAWRGRHDAMLRQRVLTTYRDELRGVDTEAVRTAGLAVLADGAPRSMAEIVEPLRERWPGPPRRALGELLVAALIPMAQLPPRGLWQRSGGVRNLPLATWLGRAVDPHDADDSDPVGRLLLRRYLAAYGPAASSDLRAWCGLAGLPAAIRAARGELVSFRDGHGRELLDLPGAPRPPADTPAPVRFLPAFDNAVLGYRDRDRIIDREHLGLSVAGERVVLVDGRVSATWRVREDHVTVTPLRPFSRTEQREIRDEGGALAEFLGSGSADVRIAEMP